MKVLLKWLNEYVKIDDLAPKDLADKLVNIGFEVETSIYLGEGLRRVITAKIIGVTKHLYADKLSVCLLDTGSEKQLTVVTGAKNVNEGDIVALALDGAIIKGKTIAVTDFKGVKSEGMLCSASELGIPDEILDNPQPEGIIILPKKATIGQDLAKTLLLDDYLFDVSITANRPDCQSVYGLARELSTALSRPLKPLKLVYKTIKHQNNFIGGVNIEQKELCPQYSGSIIKNVKIKRSPFWLRVRLWAVGHNPINNIVDITNYVLTETGQPLHAFDIKNINGGIIVRNSFKNEKIKTLDGREICLNDNLVIADKIKPLAIAGIMGGEFSGIKNDTTEVFLESARFARGNIRLSARALGIQTDSSKRFEKGVDYASVEWGRRRALSLIDTLKAGDVTDILVNDGISAPKNKIIETDLHQICTLLGVKTEEKFVVKTLTSLGFLSEKTATRGQKKSVASGLKDGLKITVPLFREDIDNFTDIAEEVIRFYGYDKLAENPVSALPMTKGGITRFRRTAAAIENISLAFGMLEVKNFSFIGPSEHDMLNLPSDSIHRRAIRISNPISEDYSLMRTQLLGSVLKTAALNIARKNKEFRIFEIDNVFIPADLPLNKLPDEQKTLCAVYSGQNESFYTLKNFLNAVAAQFNLEYVLTKSEKSYFHPGISADIIINGKNCGGFGKIHPLVLKNYEIEAQVFGLELDLTPFIEKPPEIKKFTALTKYPPVERDLAIVLDESIPVGDIFSAIKASCGLIYSTGLKDIYCGKQIEEGKKSVLIGITLLNKEKTMTDLEINETVNNVIELLKNKFNAYLR